MKVGQGRDFYRIRDMTEEDIELVHAAFVAPMNSEIQRRAAERWLNDFNMLGRARRRQGHSVATHTSRRPACNK